MKFNDNIEEIIKLAWKQNSNETEYLLRRLLQDITDKIKKSSSICRHYEYDEYAEDEFDDTKCDCENERDLLRDELNTLDFVLSQLVGT